MPTPNPLHRFRTYSYHHILIVSNSTQIVESFGADDPLVSDLSSSINLTTGEIDVRHNTGETGEYVVLINGMQDTHFLIDTVGWQTVMAPNQRAGGHDRLTTMGIEGKMKIVEPGGVRFMNVLNAAQAALEVDAAGSTYILKTIFVGYPDNGGVPEQIVNVTPFSFVPVNIEADFSEAGAEYNIDFVAINNGAAKLPQILNAAENVSSISLIEGNTLEQATKTLERNIEATYTQFVEKMKKIDKDIESKTRKVTYKIELDPAYVDEIIENKSNTNVKTTPNPYYRIDDIQQQTQDYDKETPILTFGPDCTIERAINLIMKSSKGVIADSKGLGPDKKQYIYKIHSTIESFIHSKSEYRITYKVIRYPVQTTDATKALEGDATKVNPNNYLELDYIYTGKNVDIISFDIKMAMGLAFFQTLSTSANMVDARGYRKSNTSDSKKVSGATPTDPHDSSSVRKNTPLFLPTKVKDSEVKHSTAPVDRANFETLISRHASLEGLEAKVTIHGNPILLNDLIKTPRELKSNKEVTVDRDLEDAIMLDWHKVPGLVKLNIKMPNLSGVGDYAERFWYDGYYYLFSIDNQFEGGLFTQTLDMLSLPQTNDNVQSESVEGEIEDNNTTKGIPETRGIPTT